MVQITLDIPEQIAQDAHKIAARTQRSVEDILREWLGNYVAQMPVEMLSDQQVLELSEMQMLPAQQDELADLLAQNGEGELSTADRRRLDELMVVYRQGLVRKAEALKVAVQRNLRSSLG